MLPEDKERSFLHTERFLGALSRTFKLPMEVDAAATIARFENGVLCLTLPKKLDAPTHKRVTIN